MEDHQRHGGRSTLVESGMDRSTIHPERSQSGSGGAQAVAAEVTVIGVVRCSRGIQYEVVLVDGRKANRRLCRWCTRDAGHDVFHLYDRETDEPLSA